MEIIRFPTSKERRFRTRTTAPIPRQPLPVPRMRVEMYDTGFRCESSSWDDFTAALPCDEDRNTLVAELAIEQVEQHPTLLVAETVEQVRILQEYTGDGVVIHELATEAALEEARVDLHASPLVLATYLSAVSGWFGDVSHWRALVLGTPLGNKAQLSGLFHHLSRPAPGKETAVVIDFDDGHGYMYPRLCRRMEVYTRLEIPVRRVA